MPRATADGSFTGACSLLESALGGTARHDILADASIAGDFKSALLRLRAGMRSNNWLVPADAIRLDAIVSRYDSLSRRDGFHAMHDWDGVADRVNDDIIPVDVLNFLIDQRGAEPCDSSALAILLDYYFLY